MKHNQSGNNLVKYDQNCPEIMMRRQDQGVGHDSGSTLVAGSTSSGGAGSSFSSSRNPKEKSLNIINQSC